MDFQELKALDDQYVMHTYGRFPVDVDHGENATLYDALGRSYIDFSSGIGVNSIGCAHPRWTEAIMEQAMKLGHISNLFYTEPCARLAKVLCQRAGMSNVFFGNSGAEGNEGLIKLARKYSFDKYGKGRGTVLTLKQSFHGRTLNTLAATGQEVFHNYFFPFPDGFRYAAPTMDGVSEVAGHDVCAVLLELVQGESGVYPLDQGFVHDLAVLCAERDWLLLIDEVQTGIGRTGTLFCYQQYGILPDAVSLPRGSPGACPWAASWPATSAGTCWGRAPTAPPSGAIRCVPRRPWRCWTCWTRIPSPPLLTRAGISAMLSHPWPCPVWGPPAAWA